MIYTMEVHTVRKSGSSADDRDAVILSLDGKLSAKAKRQIKAAIDSGNVTVRQSVRTIA